MHSTDSKRRQTQAFWEVQAFYKQPLYYSRGPSYAVGLIIILIYWRKKLPGRQRGACPPAPGWIRHCYESKAMQLVLSSYLVKSLLSCKSRHRCATLVSSNLQSNDSFYSLPLILCGIWLLIFCLLSSVFVHYWSWISVGLRMFCK